MSAPAFAMRGAQAAASRRAFALATSLAFGLAVWLLADRLAHSAEPVAAAALGALAGLAAAALAAVLPDTRTTGFSAVVALAALSVGLAPADPDPLALAAEVAALVLAGATAAWLVHRGGLAAPRPAAITVAALAIAALGAYGAIYIAVSRDLMFADFIRYREVSITIASIARAGRWFEMIGGLLRSMQDDYSWAPALIPGFVLAATAPLSRFVYQASLVVLYGAPALVALATLACDLARRAGLRRDSAPTAALALAAAAAFAAFPTGLAVLARGMPDIGGLVFYVAALRLAERLVRLLALPPGHDERVGARVCRVAAALALCVFAMILLRRWYAFAALGVAVMLAAEVVALALDRPRAFRWRETIMAASFGALAALVLLSPMIVAWLADPAAHDYATVYAAYRKPNGVFAAELLDWCGSAVLFAAVAGGALLLTRSRDRRLLRLTVGAAAVAAVAFLRVQTPYIHHLYLVAPALTALVGAPLALLGARRPLVACAALAALAAVTLTPLSAWAPAGLAPIDGLPHRPRADLAELERLRTWIDARARPDHRICGLGSSYAFSGQMMEELWQLEPARSPFYPEASERPTVTMSDVDTVEGAPSPEFRTCAIVVVGDPVQTHLDPAYQQTVIVPSLEMLEGVGIGAHYRRTGEVFHLEYGVEAVVFEQIAPLTDADMAALADRWRIAREGLRGELAR